MDAIKTKSITRKTGCLRQAFSAKNPEKVHNGQMQ